VDLCTRKLAATIYLVVAVTAIEEFIVDVKGAPNHTREVPKEYLAIVEEKMNKLCAILFGSFCLFSTALNVVANEEVVSLPPFYVTETYLPKISITFSGGNPTALVPISNTLGAVTGGGGGGGGGAGGPNGPGTAGNPCFDYGSTILTTRGIAYNITFPGVQGLYVQNMSVTLTSPTGTQIMQWTEVYPVTASVETTSFIDTDALGALPAGTVAKYDVTAYFVATTSPIPPAGYSQSGTVTIAGRTFGTGSSYVNASNPSYDASLAARKGNQVVNHSFTVKAGSDNIFLPYYNRVGC